MKWIATLLETRRDSRGLNWLYTSDVDRIFLPPPPKLDFSADSDVQDIYLYKLGPYGTIGPLESHIKPNSVKYYPF